mmetsp:Transcript_97022/g.175313  ORF Transcript_97022/g.175313 Transcript_97022/m.175313 type:complete len:347 (-) Transcript_97022:83-1123(-)
MPLQVHDLRKKPVEVTFVSADGTDKDSFYLFPSWIQFSEYLSIMDSIPGDYMEVMLPKAVSLTSVTDVLLYIVDQQLRFDSAADEQRRSGFVMAWDFLSCRLMPVHLPVNPPFSGYHSQLCVRRSQGSDDHGPKNWQVVSSWPRLLPPPHLRPFVNTCFLPAVLDTLWPTDCPAFKLVVELGSDWGSNDKLLLGGLPPDCSASAWYAVSPKPGFQGVKALKGVWFSVRSGRLLSDCRRNASTSFFEGPIPGVPDGAIMEAGSRWGFAVRSDGQVSVGIPIKDNNESDNSNYDNNYNDEGVQWISVASYSHGADRPMRPSLMLQPRERNTRTEVVVCIKSFTTSKPH